MFCDCVTLNRYHYRLISGIVIDVDRGGNVMNDDFMHQRMAVSPWISPKHFARVSGPVPSIDIYEQADDVVIKAEIPGVRKEDVWIDLDGDTITIAGEKRGDVREEGRGFHRVERSFGSFVRKLHLPDGFKAVFAYATFADGILEIRLPRIMRPDDAFEQFPVDRP